MSDHLKTVFTCIICLFLIVSCAPKSESEDQIDYASIPLIELQKEFSITETADYLPASIIRAMVTEEDNILVYQRGDLGIYQFDARGNFLEKVASEGQGPGELAPYSGPYYNEGVLIMANNNGLFTEFRTNENGILKYRTDYNFRLPGRMAGIRSEGDFSEAYIYKDSLEFEFGGPVPEFRTRFLHIVSIEDDSMETSEKLLSLKTHSNFIEFSNNTSMSVSTLPYRYSDYFDILPDKKLLVQKPLESSIRIYDEEMNVVHELELNIKPRPVTEEDLEFHFGELSRSERNKRMVQVMDLKPPFMSVEKDDQNRFWLHTDVTEAGREYVILSYEGKPEGRIMLSNDDYLMEIKNGRIYIVHRGDDGERIDVYSTPD